MNDLLKVPGHNDIMGVLPDVSKYLEGLVHSELLKYILNYLWDPRIVGFKSSCPVAKEKGHLTNASG